MKLGKVLLGAAIGIGAVAAVPFTGGGSILAGTTAVASLAGVGTAATAVGVAGVGAIAGAAVSELEEEEQAKDRRIAKENGFDNGLKKGEEQVTMKFNHILNDVKKRDDFLIGLTAFCYAVANCDGEITEEELDELDHNLNFIKKNGTLTPAVKGQLTKIKVKKDSFDKITHKLNKVDYESLSHFGDILDDIIDADNVRSPEELELKEKWKVYFEQRKA